MKTILNKKQKNDFLNENWKFKTFTFKWSNSGVCRIYDKRNDKTEFVAGGYGYDKKGDVLGQFINLYFSNELKKLTADNGGEAFRKRIGYYGLNHYNKNAKSHKRRYLKKATNNTISYVDGSCGFNSMECILRKIGFKLIFIRETKNEIIYILKAN